MTVKLKKLRKEFSRVIAVNDIEFSFHPGQVHGFIGPNGAGKTTTMRMLATIEAPSSGDAFIMGHSIVETPDKVRRKIGFVPDWFFGFASTTVHEYLDFFARAHELTGQERVITVGEIEDFTGLTPLREKLITELSRGMQQRVCLGRALVNNPEVLLMDEPAANLDPRARIELRELVKALAERGKAILISSHILPELSEMCDSVTIIDRGSILASGDIGAIKKKIKPNRTVAIRSAGENNGLEKILLETPGAQNVRQVGQQFFVDISGEDQDLSVFLKNLVDREVPILEFSLHEDDLEDIFMNITNGNGDKGING